MPAILSRLSILFINYISLDFDNIKILLNKLFVRYLVVKPTCMCKRGISDLINTIKLNKLNLSQDMSIKMDGMGSIPVRSHFF